MSTHVDVEEAERNQRVIICPAGEQYSLDEIRSGYLFADGSSVWAGGHCTHDRLLNQLKDMAEFKDRPECEILLRCGQLGEGWEKLWDTGVIRVMTGGSQPWRVAFHGQYVYILARVKELVEWMGPDKDRLTLIIINVIQDNTDLDLVYYIGTARNGYAWLLLGCPNSDNQREKSGGYGTCSNHIEPGEQEAHLALKKAGYRWA